MRIFGIIGYPLSHSHSPSLFKEKFTREHIKDAEYYSFPLKNLSELHTLMEEYPKLEGLNVTIPYKISVISLLDGMDEKAQAVGAVNTIKIIQRDKIIPGTTPLFRKPFLVSRKSYILAGSNTDVNGFEYSIKPLIKNNMKTALILGTGGAARAVAYVFRELGVRYLYVTRNITLHKKSVLKKIIEYRKISAETIKQHFIIVNATPAGMFPDVNGCPPIPYQHLTSEHTLFDLIYNPPETRFLKQGKKHGAKIINGLQMLRHQAEKTWEIWNKK